jgi:type IV secretory pathway VirB9-like protein
MRVPMILLVVAGLQVVACTHEPQLPPALPEEPVIIEPLLQQSMQAQLITLLETPGRGTEGYWRRRTPQPIRFTEPPDVRPERPKARALPLDKLIEQAHQAAQVLPSEEGYFGGRAIYRFPYLPGKISVIATNPQTFTKLYFPPGEKHVTLPTLNEEVWKTVDAYIGPPERMQYVLGVRPMEPNLRADIALEMESGHSYLLRFVPSKAAMLAVTWELPTAAPTVPAETTAHPYGAPGAHQSHRMPVDLASLHTGYRIEPTGKPGFVPTQVYDDGTRTIVKMKAFAGNAPVVFTYKADGSRGLVQFAPYVIPGDPTRAMYYVIESIWPKIELAGTDGASVMITRVADGLTIAQPWQRP